MADEIRIFQADDPNDAPERRLSAFPTINPFIPTSLPQYVIPPVANSLYTAMQYYWYSAYQQGIAAQKQQQHQLFQQQQEHNHQSIHTQHQQHQHHQYRQESPTLQHQEPLINDHNDRSRIDNLNRLDSLSCSGPSSSSSSSSPASSSNTNNDHHHHHHHQHHHHQQPSHQLHSHSNSDSHEQQQQQQQQKQHQHIKKPLNPFMIYMQKRRPEIVRQGLIKESAAINRMLGQQWRQLSKEEQEPYYKLAEEEKLLHAQKYPGWSARDNYANQKKKKKMKLKSISLNGLDQSDKKCRARFGLNNMSSWCKPCKRKKKCIYSRPNAQINHLPNYHYQHIPLE